MAAMSGQEVVAVAMAAVSLVVRACAGSGWGYVVSD
jgi:hypothetical protein